jgi:hypothetical protein
MTTLQEKQLERRVEEVERRLEAALAIIGALLERIHRLEDKQEVPHGDVSTRRI